MSTHAVAATMTGIHVTHDGASYIVHDECHPFMQEVARANGQHIATVGPVFTDPSAWNCAFPGCLESHS